MSHTRRILAAVGLTTALMASFTTAANASGWVWWNTRTNLLQVSGFGSTAYAQGAYRVTTGSNGTIAQHSGYLWYKNANDHKAYINGAEWVNSGWCWQPEGVSCQQQFYRYAAQDSTHISKAEQWVEFLVELPMDPASNRTKGRAEVSIDVPWNPDPTSQGSFTPEISY